MQRTTILLVALVALAACQPKPNDSAYYNRGGPESRLDVSSEVVNLSVGDNSALGELSHWIKTDQPTRAELYCFGSDPRCTEARKVLDLHGVPTMNVESGDFSVALVYERILARDCNQRFTDNSTNQWNTNHASFGCSVSANIVQHVSDKQQFIQPNITDVPRAVGAVQSYDRAMTPRTTPTQGYSVEQSLTEQQGN